METKELIQKKIVYWKKKLIDLSKRNNLISYRFTKSKSLKIISPEVSKIIESIDNETKIRLLREKKSDNKETSFLCSEDEKTVEKKLYTLYLKNREDFQELGVNTCFISVGTLKYKENDKSDIFLEAPIFLYPVEISRSDIIRKDEHRFEITTSSDELNFNPALKEMLFYDYKIDLKQPKEDGTIFEYLEYFKGVISGMRNWEISMDVYLDLFHYQKYVMYEDITHNESLVINNQLIKAYVGDRSALQDDIAEFQREEFDDADSVDVLDADSSQKRAIKIAKAGVTFVLQGPPGTGKSQTIANIIAALIEQKKKILFVSQKMAALNVVQKRLEEVGLGRYCLNLHKYKGNKREVINQLMTELQTSPKINDAVKRFDFTNYLHTQKEINDFYTFLCTKHEPWKLSIYGMRGELAKYYNIEILDKKLNQTLTWSTKEFSMLLGKIDRLNDILGRIENPLGSFYFNFKKEKNTALSKNNFIKLLENLSKDYKSIASMIKELEKDTKISISKFEEIKILADIWKEIKNSKFKNFPEWLITNKLDESKKLLIELHKLLEEQRNLKEQIISTSNKEFLKIDTGNTEKFFKNTSFLGRFLSREYKDQKKSLDNYTKNRLGHNDCMKLFKSKNEYERIGKRICSFVESNSNLCKNIGNCQDILKITELKDLASFISESLKIASELEQHNNYKIVQFIIKQKETDFYVLHDNFYKSIDNLNEFFEKEIMLRNGSLENVIITLNKLNSEINKISDILMFKEEFALFHDEVKEFIQSFITAKFESKLKDVFLKSYYLQILDELLKKNSKMSPKDLVEKFRSEDTNVKNMWRYKVMEAIEEQQPKEHYQGHGDNEKAILLREHQKKRRLKPIRDLLQEIPNLVFTLKPCFMMSPLTVSQYINAKDIKFDVVIFDEASQIMPEDAVPCLIRAKQAIIMGDTQQLPPTTFFLSQDDEESEEGIEDLPSFLSEASTKFRSKSLNWHYRSKNENLIAFSNRFFYENRLITFPNPNTNDKSGLDLVYVKKGIYDRGKSRKNREEAKEVVKAYRELKSMYNDKSIGIIAFSIAQENAIREEFQMAGINFDASIDSDTEELFIKNLETVQGDERDIILLSVGYGKDSQGKLSYNFGPLNKEGGYKRLNVAITRSRFKTVVISSILPEELDEDKLSADGVRYLKRYLDYAKSKDFNRLIEKTEALAFDSSFEEAVYDALIKNGFSISSQVGCSGYKIDLVIKHPKKPGEYILGIECDGSQYHSSRYARDRDKIRQIILEDLGWKIHRIWSEDWLNNMEHEIEKLKERVRTLLKGDKTPIAKKSLKLPKVETVEDFKEIKLNSKYQKYKVAQLPSSNLSLEFNSYGEYTGNSESKIIKMMLSVLEVESPIEKELLFKRVLECFDIQKLGNRIENLFLEILADLQKDEKVYVNQNTVSLEKIQINCPVRISTEEERPFVFIPKEELGCAIMDILKNTFSITKEALITDIAREIYGNNRIGSKIEAKIEEAIKYLLKLNIIEESNRKIQMKKSQ